MARKSPSDRTAEGYSSKISKGERCLANISFSKSLPASAIILDCTASSVALAAIRATFYFFVSIEIDLMRVERTLRVAG